MVTEPDFGNNLYNLGGSPIGKTHFGAVLKIFAHYFGSMLLRLSEFSYMS